MARAALPAGEIVRVLERANPTIVGTLERSGGEEWVIPADPHLPRVRVKRGSLGAAAGERVVVALAGYPGRNRPESWGSVVERLGPAGDPDAETWAIIREAGLRESFPEEVLAEAEALPREVGPSDREGRVDLRAEVVFTVDDADARDLDDAVSLSAGPGGTWRLGVHIADLARYVPAGTALDREARVRGTSVYLVDRVLPMFPPRLSNGIASLHPGPDRLTVSVLMDIDERGRVVGYDLTRSVIRSVARLTYDAVATLLGVAGPAAETASPEPAADPAALASTVAAVAFPPAVAAILPEMTRLAERLRRRRLGRGSLDFDLAEEKVELDGRGRPVAVVRRPRNAATQLIEEFMIAANETVADYLEWSGLPFIRRVHEDPFPDDLAALRDQLAPLGYRVPATRAPRPADLAAILEASRGRPEAEAVHAALLRALPQARYSAVRLGHFALASPNYTHFTSPIRRYPDLTVHRQVVTVLAGDVSRDATGMTILVDDLTRVAETTSRAERRAEKAEAESVKLKKTELAKLCLGSVDEGEVVGVFDFGAFVRLPNGVEGLVPSGELGRDGARVGQRLRVQVVRVDVARRHVDLGPVT